MEIEWLNVKIEHQSNSTVILYRVQKNNHVVLMRWAFSFFFGLMGAFVVAAKYMLGVEMNESENNVLSFRFSVSFAVYNWMCTLNSVLLWIFMNDGEKKTAQTDMTL